MSANSNSTAPLVVLGVTGSIAAYKACELVRALQHGGCDVRVLMTESAERFVGAATFQALTGQPVGRSLWEEPDGRVHHLDLAGQADVFAVVPATANVVAKIATGRADDLLTTSALATEAPLVIAPAMNVHMWRKQVTQENVAALRARGAVVVEPASGELACGDVGEGKLADVEEIAAAILAEAHRARDLEGVHVLVYSGPTYEPIDAVRFIGNRSSGKTGHALALEAARRAATVTLVTGPTALADPFGVTTVHVTTALEMHEAVLAHYPSADVVIAAAAVSDFRVAGPAGIKLSKGETPRKIELVQNPDILAELGAQKDGRLLVGFAAQTHDVVSYARGKLAGKGADLIVANDVSVAGLGFGADDNRVVLVSEEGEEELPVYTKRALAGILIDRIAPLAQGARARRNEKE